MKRSAFKTIQELKASSFWEKLSIANDNKTSRIFSSTRLEDMIYSDLRSNMDSPLDALEAEGLEKLDSFPALIRDTFQALYSLNPRRNDTENLSTNARLFNAEVINHLTDSEDYSVLKSFCEGRELPAYEAVNEFSDKIFEKLDDLLSKTGGNKNALNVLNKLEKQRNDLKDRILDLAGQLNTTGDKDKILDLAAKAVSKEQQIEKLSGMVSKNTLRDKEAIDDIEVNPVHRTGKKESYRRIS